MQIFKILNIQKTSADVPKIFYCAVDLQNSEIANNSTLETPYCDLELHYVSDQTNQSYSISTQIELCCLCITSSDWSGGICLRPSVTPNI